MNNLTHRKLVYAYLQRGRHLYDVEETFDVLFCDLYELIANLDPDSSKAERLTALDNIECVADALCNQWRIYRREKRNWVLHDCGGKVVIKTTDITPDEIVVLEALDPASQEQ